MNLGDRVRAVCDKALAENVRYTETKKNLAEALENKDKAFSKLSTYDASVAIIQGLATSLQNNIIGRITTIVQRALDATFPSNIFTMEFVSRRNKTEVDMYIADAQGNRQSILDGCGGGLKKMVSIALRMAVWSLDKNSSSVLILDEPIPFVSRGHRQQCADMFRTLSHELGIQLIIVSHEEELISSADISYEVSLDSEKKSRTVEC